MAELSKQPSGRLDFAPTHPSRIAIEAFVLQPILIDLLQQRASLLEALEVAMRTKERSDYVDCWNLLDEIAEHDRRIATLRSLMSEVDGPRIVRN